MKTPIFLILFVCGLFSSEVAIAQQTSNKSKQSLSFKKGQVDLNVGVGFISFPTMSIYTKQSTIPLHAAVDVGISKRFAIGINYSQVKMESHILPLNAPRNAAYRSSSKEDWAYFDHTVSNVSLRFTAHFTKHEKFDIYGGGMIGYHLQNINSQDESLKVTDYFDEKSRSLSLSGILGMRYHINSRFGGFAEIAYGVALINVGLNHRF